MRISDKPKFHKILVHFLPEEKEIFLELKEQFELHYGTRLRYDRLIIEAMESGLKYLKNERTSINQ
ncbi:MAG: hypothetical protein WAV84_15475 [Bacteroidota bacterium]